MARSTAKFISYDLRPAKQSERGMIIDIIRIGGDCGLPIRKYRYVGMGANRFYDFLMLHKYVGIKKMVSLEHDGKMYRRATFNVPYKFIDVRNTSAADFLATDTEADPDIFWFDYDGGIGPQTVDDILSMSMRMKVGDFCFVTVSGNPPRSMDRLNDSARLVALREAIPDHAALVDIGDVERASFPTAVHKILTAAFKYSFSTKRDGKFVPLLQVEYSDSMSMLTFGGAFLNDSQASRYKASLKTSLPFLNNERDELYEIRSFHLTERERSLFDLAVTSAKKRSAERNRLKKLGFNDAEIKSYEELIRYTPRYVETIL